MTYISFNALKNATFIFEMVRLLSILLSFIILFHSLNIYFDDILELNELVEHYQFHSEEYGDSFLVFLSKHYGKLKTEHHKKHQEEQQEHEELPFQNPATTLSLLVFVQYATSEYHLRTGATMKKTDGFHYLVTYTSLWDDGPFQPPRRA
ncbi:hypothetical protein [Poritiphilus flavus]|uniref:Uncharacterized protein n=1 Tax=Poritiphilus flavus TaxID=2697053 RepID=A0A6L9EE04_9FLAO|nr:hypothetical protein [Poritiphilus flavus]NAS12927.1 hypothetical protein [Poritiphilus flavus]